MKIPKEIIPEATTKTILQTILTTLILVLLTNIAIALLLPSIQPNRGYWLIQQKWNWILNTNENVDMLILGDSSGNQGFIPEIYSKITGRSAYNACTIGDMTLSNDAWMLDEYLKRHLAPKQVLILHTFDAWNRSVQVSCLANIPISIDDLHPPLGLNIKQKKDYWLCRLFPLYAYSYSIKEVLLKPHLALTQRVHLTNGYMCVQEPNTSQVHESMAHHIADIEHNSEYSLNVPHIEALKYINNLAATFNFQVFLVNTPYCDQLDENLYFLMHYKKIQTMLNQLTKEFSHITFIEKRMTYPANLMEQDDHLIHRTAIDFTKRITEQLTAF